MNHLNLSSVLYIQNRMSEKFFPSAAATAGCTLHSYIVCNLAEFADGIQVQEVTGVGEREGVAPQLVQEGQGQEQAEPALLPERDRHDEVRVLTRHHLRDRPRDEHGRHAVEDGVGDVAGRPAHRRHPRRRRGAVLHRERCLTLLLIW